MRAANAKIAENERRERAADRSGDQAQCDEQGDKQREVEVSLAAIGSR